MNNKFDKLIITVMDRFVWFILLVVVTHLVTEFTRTNGFSRNLFPMNESTYITAIEVPSLQQFPNHNLDIIQEPSNAAITVNEEQKTFNFRPLIDSIFDIPLSALNAVNRLIQTLTGNYITRPLNTYPEASPLKEKSS